MLIHIDLFTGLGGFSLAARRTGFRTVVMCESDPFRRAGLERAWPGVPIVHDVRDFHWPLEYPGSTSKDAITEGMRSRTRPVGESTERSWPLADTASRTMRENSNNLGKADREIHPLADKAVSILTAGVPCQPASRAGKQRGSGDDRWLWPETVRILGEARPRFALFENPLGIEDVGLDGVLASVEAQGYTIRAILDIPACAVNAPHLRRRLWIVADTGQEGREERKLHGSLPGGEEQPDKGEATFMGCDAWNGHVADTGCVEEEGGWTRPDNSQGTGSCPSIAGLHPWTDHIWLPCADGKLRRAPLEPQFVDDGLPKGLPRKLVAALGDSIVWQIAAEIMWAIRLEIEADVREGKPWKKRAISRTV